MRVKRSFVMPLVVVAALLMSACNAPSGVPSAPVDSNQQGVPDLAPLPASKTLPIVFVHGSAGSAQQYESQAMRFAANGYPLDHIFGYDHDGIASDFNGFVAGLDGVINNALAATGSRQVYLVAHSRGTIVSSLYLRDPGRRSKVAKYVALDGATCDQGSSSTVPCLDPTVQSPELRGQGHVETATSPESFRMQYRFLVGENPRVVDIVPQRDPVVVNGTAVSFPANTGRAGARLRVFEINSQTAERITQVADYQLGASGKFGPLVVDSSKHYEFELDTPTSDPTVHVYPQRFLRNTNLFRILSSPPGSAKQANYNNSGLHTNVLVSRMREWYTGQDVLAISTSTPVGLESVSNAVPRSVGSASIALHIHDAKTSPGNSSLSGIPYFDGLQFQSGVDVFMRAGRGAPNGTITATNMPRGDFNNPQRLRARNWPSDSHTVTFYFADSPQPQPQP